MQFAGSFKNCSCGTTYVTDYVEAHQFTVTVVPATCHDIGYKEHVCDLCEYLKRDYFTDLDDSNHVFFYPADYEDEEKAGKPNLVETVASTCKDYGYSTYACIYCNAEAKFEITPELAEHTFEEWNILSKPTCTKEGFKERTCTLCGAIEQTKIAVSGHVWSEYEVVVDNIHLNALYQERTCIDCATTEAHPEIIEDVLALELRENANGKYYVVKNMNPGKNCTTIVVPEFMYLNGEKVSVTENSWQEINEKASARFIKIQALSQVKIDEIVILKDGKPLEIKGTFENIVPIDKVSGSAENLFDDQENFNKEKESVKTYWQAGGEYIVTFENPISSAIFHTGTFALYNASIL